jgi:GMP synthase (glutamine-hydrolysing)
MDVKKFVDDQCKQIQKVVGSDRALIAVSGGVDSTTCAVLTHKAIKKNLQCVFIDTGFMRLGEPEEVKSFYERLNLPFKVVDARKLFIDSQKGLVDAEDKRKKFRQNFYETLSNTAKSENCKFLVQGTIAPDWIETKGGIKTQHNVLDQIGINPKEKFGFKLIEPLAYLYKDQVREVATYFNVPIDFSQRPPFPGPGLLVRVIGQVIQEKLDTEKIASKIVDENLEGSQYFAAIIDDDEEESKNSIVEITAKFFKIEPKIIKVKIPKNLVTGVKGDLRAYKKLALVSIRKGSELFLPELKQIEDLQVDIISKSPDFTRVAYDITKKPRKGEYIILIRSVTTRDFMSAEVTKIPWSKLISTADKIMNECKNVSEVYYDVTPKPPATVEYE